MTDATDDLDRWMERHEATKEHESRMLPSKVWAFIDLNCCYGISPDLMLFYDKKDADDMLDSMGPFNKMYEVKELEITK